MLEIEMDTREKDSKMHVGNRGYNSYLFTSFSQCPRPSFNLSGPAVVASAQRRLELLLGFELRRRVVNLVL